MSMTITNQTNQDYWFGPLHLPAGVGTGTLVVDDTSATSLYLTDDAVADQINALYACSPAKITVTGFASPFPRPTGEPEILHGDGSPEGLIYAPQGSLFLSRSASVVYQKSTGVFTNTGWQIVGSNGLVAPSGSVTAYTAATAPSGWLLCDGSAVSRAVYSVLFSVIGTTFGAGDGTTTFNLPDMRGRMIAGLAVSGGHTDVNAIAKTEGVSSVAYRRPKHKHTTHDPGHGHYVVGSHSVGGGYPGINAGVVNQDGGAYITTGFGSDATTTGVVVGSDITNDAVDAPSYLVLNFIIKT
jgi:microcystin-dependent protein